MYKTLKLAKMIVISLSVVFSMVFIGNQVMVNADESDHIEIVNIIDSNGNPLRKQQTQIMTEKSPNLSASVPGLDPAKALSKIQITDNADGSQTTIYKVDYDQQVIDYSVENTNGKMTHPFTLEEIKKQLPTPVSSLSDALAKIVDVMNYGVYFYTTPGTLKYMTYTNAKEVITVTYFVKASIPVQYVDNSGKTVANDTITDYPGQSGSYTPKAPDGYQLVDTKPIAYTLGEKKNPAITVHVVKKAVTPNGPSDNSSTTVTPTTPVTPTPSMPAGETTKQPAEPTIPNYAAKKGAAVYATRAIYLYKNANFRPSQRLAKYPKVKRVNRPMFVVTDYARSTNGTLRYKVRDVNHGSKTAGKIGYITANSKFVAPVYYSSMPKNKKITVINKKGINAYKNANLTKQVKNYKKGARLTVKKIVKHNLTSRYQLSNGDYITANKKLIIQGNY